MLAFRLLEARDGRGVWDSPSLVERCSHGKKSQIEFPPDRPIEAAKAPRAISSEVWYNFFEKVSDLM